MNKTEMLTRYYQSRTEFPDEAFTPQQLAVRNELVAAGMLEFVPRIAPIVHYVRTALRDWGRK